MSKTQREKLNKLVEKRKKTTERLKKLKSKKKAPLKKIRTKIQENKKKKIQKKINKNPKAISDRKKVVKKVIKKVAPDVRGERYTPYQMEKIKRERMRPKPRQPIRMMIDPKTGRPRRVRKIDMEKTKGKNV